MKRHIASQLATILVAVGFGLFVLHGVLTSSDFPRGLYGPPDASHWGDFAALNPNRVWNYNWGGNASLNAYLVACSTNGIKAYLRLDPQYSGEFDTFYMEDYSCAQHHIYQAEQHYDTALYKMEHEDPLGFYFFNHASTWNGTVRGELDPYQPDDGDSWRCTHNAPYGQGIMLRGPNETLEGEDDTSTWASQQAWPDAAQDRNFKSIIRVMADLDGLEPTDTVFYWRIFRIMGSTTITFNSAYYTADSFAQVSYPQWKKFELEYTIPTGGFNLLYTVDWKNRCDFWVDWVEFYDMNRGRYLFTDQDTRDSVLALIAYQCDSLEGLYGNILAGWKQSDEPIRSSFDAHGVVNLMARDSLDYPPVTPFAQLTSAGGGSTAWFLRRPELFALLGRPAANYPAR